MANPGDDGYLSKLDANQVLRAAWDEDNKRLRTDAEIINPVLEVHLDASNDSVAIGDGTDTLDINADGSINVQIQGDVAIEISAADGDNVAISDGIHTLDVNADGSINAVVTATNLDTRPLDATIDNIAISDGNDALAVNADGSINVTASAGTNLNTSLLALDSTVAKDSSLSTINTSINTLLKPANTLAAVTTVGTITNVVHVDDNSGSLTVDNNGTFAVQAAQSGTWNTRLQDTDGNGITSQVNGSQRAVDVGINVSGVQVDPRAAVPGTLTDRSGIATNTSTQIMAANSSRKFLFIQNLGNAALYFNFTSPATVGAGSIELSQFACFTMEGSFVSTQAVNIIRSGGSNINFTAKEG